MCSKWQGAHGLERLLHKGPCYPTPSLLTPHASPLWNERRACTVLSDTVALLEKGCPFSGLSEYTAYPKIAQNICLWVSGLHSFDDLPLSIKKISACTPNTGIRPYEIHVCSSFSVYILCLKYNKG